MRSAARQAQSTSEQAMLRRQRRDQDGCAQHTGTRAQLNPVAVQLWSEAQQKELERQHGMQKARRLEGAELGFDLEPLAEAHSERLEEHRRKTQKTAMEYQQRQKRLAAMRDTTPVALGPGTRLYAAADCLSAEVLHRVARHRLRREARLPMANLFMVDDPAHPPLKVDLVATLVGGMVVDPSVFHTPNPQALCYGRAFRKRRHLWISPQCREESPQTVAMLQEMITEERRAGREAGWHISAIMDLDTFIATHQARTRSHAAEVLAVVGLGQRGRPPRGLAPSRCVTLDELKLRHREVQLNRLKFM